MPEERASSFHGLHSLVGCYDYVGIRRCEMRAQNSQRSRARSKRTRSQHGIAELDNLYVDLKQASNSLFLSSLRYSGLSSLVISLGELGRKTGHVSAFVISTTSISYPPLPMCLGVRTRVRWLTIRGLFIRLLYTNRHFKLNGYSIMIFSKRRGRD